MCALSDDCSKTGEEMGEVDMGVEPDECDAVDAVDWSDMVGWRSGCCGEYIISDGDGIAGDGGAEEAANTALRC